MDLLPTTQVLLTFSNFFLSPFRQRMYILNLCYDLVWDVPNQLQMLTMYASGHPTQALTQPLLCLSIQSPSPPRPAGLPVSTYVVYTT